MSSVLGVAGQSPHRLSREGPARTIAAAALLVTGLCGCLSPGSSPQSAVETFLRALGAKDTATACSVVAYAGQPLAGDDVTLCRSGFDAVVAEGTPTDLDALRSATVVAVSVSGDRATVRAEDLSGVPTAYRQPLALVRVGGQWYVDVPQ